MISVRLTNGAISADCLLDGKNVSIRISGCKKPLRIYAIGDTVFYGGIAEPCGESRSRLSFMPPFKPSAVIVSEGRIEDEHNEIFRFVFGGIAYSLITEFPKIFANEFEKELFSQDSLKACFEFYGHYIVFSQNQLTYYAFPSDFFTHPLLQFLPYSFWYDADICGRHRGYYFIGYGETALFSDFNTVTELLRNKTAFDQP